MKHRTDSELREYFIQQSHNIESIEGQDALEEYLLGDSYLLCMIHDAVVARTKVKRGSMIIRIILYIRAISMITGLRKGYEQNEREEE